MLVYPPIGVLFVCDEAQSWSIDIPKAEDILIASNTPQRIGFSVDTSLGSIGDLCRIYEPLAVLRAFAVAFLENGLKPPFLTACHLVAHETMHCSIPNCRYFHLSNRLFAMLIHPSQGFWPRFCRLNREYSEIQKRLHVLEEVKADLFVMEVLPSEDARSDLKNLIMEHGDYSPTNQEHLARMDHVLRVANGDFERAFNILAYAEAVCPNDPWTWIEGQSFSRLRSRDCAPWRPIEIVLNEISRENPYLIADCSLASRSRNPKTTLFLEAIRQQLAEDEWKTPLECPFVDCTEEKSHNAILDNIRNALPPNHRVLQT